jgi:hypothetical protein
LILAAVDGQLVLFPGEIARGEPAILQLIRLLKQQVSDVDFRDRQHHDPA